MPKIKPQDLDDNYELVEDTQTQKPVSLKFPKGKQESTDKRKLTKIARRRERLANRKWENTDD